MPEMLNVKLNKKELENKILGCWIGKNIGGTIGAPYEAAKEVLDVKGFITEKGNPLPNDDLDLQLAWLQAISDVGPKALNANILADYWLSYISPHWNEYGNARANMNMGLLPPLSGEVCNERWKTSNGAWIRSEIWACLAPGLPNVAVKYAIMDASIDHGLNEGTYAEMFTAALESEAFYMNDVRAVVEKALTYIPYDCRIAKGVRTVLEGYDAKLPWQTVREKLIEQCADLGWFQAPANLAYVVIGLIYGEGDFKKSVLLAVNCGDDTDCTAATCGSVLGIMLGADKIPSDWQEYIGHNIVTCCINASYLHEKIIAGIPKNCQELTTRIMDLIPEVMRAHDIRMEYTDSDTEMDFEKTNLILKDYAQHMFKRSPYSFEISSLMHTDAVVEYEKEPRVKAEDEFKVKITLKNCRRDARHMAVDVVLPEGWSADYQRSVYLVFDDEHHNLTGTNESVWEMTVRVGENVNALNNIYISFSNVSAHAAPLLVPVVLLG